MAYAQAPRNCRLEQRDDGRFDIIDVETGEVEAEGVLILRPTPVRAEEEFTMLMAGGSRYLAQNPEIGRAEYRVLHYMISEMDYENRIDITQKAIAEALDYSPSAVSKAVTTLVDERILHRRRNCHGWLLDDRVGWRGKQKNLRKRRRKKNRERQERLELVD